MASVEDVNVPKFTGWKEAKETLKDIRDSGKRESSTVLVLGKKLVSKYTSNLGDEGAPFCFTTLH